MAPRARKTSPTPAGLPEPLVTASVAAKLLGVARSTFYTIAFFKMRAIMVTDTSPRYSVADIELYKSLRKSERPSEGEGEAA